MSDATKQELLRKAVELSSRAELAQGLETDPAVLDAWISGRASMPDGKLLLLADMFEKMAHSIQPLATTSSGSPAPK